MNQNVINDKALSELKKIWTNNGVVYVSGINGTGESFDKVPVRVAHDDKSGFGAYEDYVCFESAIIKRSSSNHRASSAVSNLFAIYETTLDVGGFQAGNLIVFSIQDENGNVIFENPNKEEILEIAEENKRRESKNMVEEGREITPETTDTVVESLKQQIGKPVIIHNETGILSAVSGFDDMGGVMVTIKRATLNGLLSLDSNNPMYYSFKENGERVKHSTNASEQVNVRLQKLQEMQSSGNQPQ